MTKLMPGDKVTFLYDHQHYWRKSQRGRVVSQVRGQPAFVFMGQVGADGNHRMFRVADEGITWIRGWCDQDEATLSALIAAFTLARSK